MNLLLNTHVFLWMVAEPSRIDRRILAALASPDNEVIVSAATPWEIAIKQACGRLTFPLERFDEIMQRMGCDMLPILPAHGIAAGSLPRHHADPFDRMLIAQARIETLTLVTHDDAIRRYDVAVLEVSRF
ncbi:type II toxin-antitoxin system VapC family toxin [Rhodopila sp.]|uniref:type II toxin-antitoxin system VapC family toxin n=1 Tax=Rhodopila sp. TaxID=2480087 RepID=UPI003D0CF151